MRVLSPRMLPPLTGLLGSTASTATRWPRSTRWSPRASISVLLPTPGGPVMPTRTAPAARRHEPVEDLPAAKSASSGRVLSRSVMAFATARRSPARTAAHHSSARRGLMRRRARSRTSRTAASTSRAAFGTGVPGPKTAATPCSRR